MIINQKGKRTLIVVSILVIAEAVLCTSTLHINKQAELTTESTTATTTTSVVTTTTEVVTELETSFTTENKTTTTTETTTEKTTEKQTTTTERETTTKKETTTKDRSGDAKYSASQFRRDGVLHWGGWRWTWYSERVLPGNGLNIPGRHADDNGYICDKNDYICIASSTLSKGTVIDTPLGKQGKVYDSGCASDIIDVYVNW